MKRYRSRKFSRVFELERPITFPTFLRFNYFITVTPFTTMITAKKVEFLDDGHRMVI